MSAATEKELHLANQNEQLRTQIKNLELLYGDVEENMNEKIKELTAENKTMVEKINKLETKVYLLGQEKAELSERIDQPGIEKPDLEPRVEESPLSESFLDRYENLGEKVDELNELNNSKEAKLREMEKQMKEILGRNELLESEISELKDDLSSVNKQNHLLSKENKTLSETITLLQRQMEDSLKPIATPLERGNSMFDEVDVARKSAEEELKRAVEQNCYLKLENDALQLRLRRYAHSTLSHADQVEIEFQKEHSKLVFSQMEEFKKTNERYAQQIRELTEQLASSEKPDSISKNVLSAYVKRQLDLAHEDLVQKRKLIDEQNKKVTELSTKNLEIPVLNGQIKRLELKILSLEDELKLAIETNNGNAANDGKENASSLASAKPETGKSRKCSTKTKIPCPSNLPEPQPVVGASTAWVSKLKKNYKEVARENPYRQISLSNRASRPQSTQKDQES